MDLTIYPEPNPAVTAALLSAATRAYLEGRLLTAAMLYQAQVAKISTRLARSAHTHVGIGGADHDRWVGDLVVGGQGASGAVDYAAAHDFGRGIHPRSVVNLDGRTVVQKPADDLEKVLQMLGDY